MDCKNCNNPVNDRFCGNCGQPVQLKRVDGHYVLHEIQHILHIEKGFPYTIKELLIRPGKIVREFITHNRSRLVKPILFMIVTSLIYTLISKFFHVEGVGLNLPEVRHSAIGAIFHWIDGHYGYANIMMGVFIALFLKLFYRKRGYNLFELLILLCFVMGMGMLISAVFALVEGLTGLHLATVSSFIGMIYCTWAIAQFFGKVSLISYLKSVLSYIAGANAFYLVAVLVGVAVDLIYRALHA